MLWHSATWNTTSSGKEPVMQPQPTEARPSRPPIQQVATGTVAGGVGGGGSTLVIGAHPAPSWPAPVIGTAVTGMLSGVGAAARNRIAGGRGGWLTLLAQMFGWLG